MADNSGIQLFIPLFFLLLFLLRRRPKKREDAPVEIQKEPVLREKLLQKRVKAFEKPKVEDVHTPPPLSPQEDFHYLVEKKEKESVLQKNWSSKKSIRQAFILSEIFRRIDE
jgi:hypothetical protein